MIFGDVAQRRGNLSEKRLPSERRTLGIESEFGSCKKLANHLQPLPGLGPSYPRRQSMSVHRFLFHECLLGFFMSFFLSFFPILMVFFSS